MCLIIVKPIGANLPTKNCIQQAFENNDDGFGLAYWGKGMDNVLIEKGAMTLARTIELIDSIENPKGKLILMHFRLATTGWVSEGNCHPFPISKHSKLLKAAHVSTNIAIAHNGMIINDGFIANDDDFGWEDNYFGAPTQVCGTPEGNVSIHYRKVQSKYNVEFSDTQNFIKNYLADMGDALFNKAVLKMIENFSNSKFAFITNTGGLYMVGTFTKFNKCFYSNCSFKESRYYVIPSKVATTPTTPYVPPADSTFAPCDLCKTWVSRKNMKLIEDLNLCLSCQGQIGLSC